MSILANVINSYTAPSKVFEAVKDFDWKKAIVPLLILAVLGVISYWVIQDLADDFGYEKAVSVIENMDRLTDEQKVEQIAKIEDRMDGPQISSWISSGLAGPVTVFFMALVALLVGNTFMGGSAKYGQLLNVTAWAYMINILESLVKIPLMLNKWSLEVYTGLGVLGIGEKGSFINSLLAGIDIFAIWRIILIAIGMGIIYNKKTKPYLIAMLVTWFVLRLIGAGFSSFFMGLTG
ncbi:MAG: YIP1 family protein [Candidatus Marinimicrobia bacterium]|nr:YIP1 family protein [Candidatus Neomarinimicrobiota bacterium]